VQRIAEKGRREKGELEVKSEKRISNIWLGHPPWENKEFRMMK